MNFFTIKHSRYSCQKRNFSQKFEKGSINSEPLRRIFSKVISSQNTVSFAGFFNIIKRKKTGATLIEYTLIASLIATMLMAGYKSVGTGYMRIYNNIATAI